MLKNIILLLSGLILGSLLTTYFLYRKGFYTPALFDLNIYLLVNTAFCIIAFIILSILFKVLFKYSFTINDFIIGFLFSIGLIIIEELISYFKELNNRGMEFAIIFILLPILIYLIVIVIDLLISHLRPWK